MRLTPWLIVLLTFATVPSPAAEFPNFEAQEIDPHIGNVCYALTVADVDNDGKPDVVGLSEDAVVWYHNPDWKRADLIRDQTKRDNVCIQPMDIDRDGQIDFAVGAGWAPPNTKTASTLQWIGRDKEGRWQVHPISSFQEPMLHRIRWADVLGTGRPQLVVAPLQGRDTKGPDWGSGPGVQVQVFSIPDDPTRPDWPVTTASNDLHCIHNLWPIEAGTLGPAPAKKSAEDILLAAWEGVFLLSRSDSDSWTETRLGAGNQESSPSKGASEIKLGHLADGSPYIATIEPWHGFQVVVYTPPKQKGALWNRHVIDEPVTWGHAVWVANLDDDKDEELIIGQRDPNPSGASIKGPGVRVYDPKPGDSLTFDRHVLDDGGMACEDALATDLNGDGRVDIIAGGRATHNVKIYWNRGR